MQSIKLLSILTLLTFFNVGCKKDDKNSTMHTTADPSSIDVHTYARPAEAVIKHLNLHLTADFNAK